MPDRDCGTDSAIATELLRTSFKSQYRAALQMLRQAIEQCPEDLWNSSDHTNSFWGIAYHALFFTHLYMQPNEAAFQPWEHHREEYQFLGNLPWPPHRAPKIGEPYTKAEVLTYCLACEKMIDAAVEALDLQAPDCGFWWYKMPKLEHQIVNIRHIQHHAGQLADRVHAVTGAGVDWKGACHGGDPH
jgi:hypothetical protein